MIAQVSFLVVAGNRFRWYLLTYHTSCAVVSVFWLRWEIVFGCTVYKKDSYSLSLIERESASKCVYFVRSNTLLLCNSLLCIYLLYCTDPHTAYLFLALYGSTTLQSLLFLKNIKNFLFKKKLVNNCSIPSIHVERKITILSHEHSFTPYPSLSPYSPTDRITDEETNTLAARGLEEIFFQLCWCVSFWFWREIGFGFTYYLCT